LREQLKSYSDKLPNKTQNIKEESIPSESIAKAPTGEVLAFVRGSDDNVTVVSNREG
jgi:hypothetical protein